MKSDVQVDVSRVRALNAAGRQRCLPMILQEKRDTETPKL